MTGLPPHLKILIAYKAFFIDSWDDEKMEFRIDNVVQNGVTKYIYTQGTPQCGLINYGDKILDIYHIIAHTGSTI